MSDNIKKAIAELSSYEVLFRAAEVATKRVEIIHTALEALTREEQRILVRTYIEARDEKAIDISEDLCDELGCACSTLYLKRDKALRKFAIALWGEETEKEK